MIGIEVYRFLKDLLKEMHEAIVKLEHPTAECMHIVEQRNFTGRSEKWQVKTASNPIFCAVSFESERVAWRYALETTLREKWPQ